MKENIYTIPINEAFEKKDGCPVCALYNKVKQNALEFVTGAAMMEPDIRIQTNELGFCRPHFDDMLGLNNRLSVSLMLESHLDRQIKTLLSKTSGLLSSPQKSADAFSECVSGCFVCSRINEQFGHFLDNICHMYAELDGFAPLYRSQTEFCLPHAADLCRAASQKLNKRAAQELTKETVKIAIDRLAALRADVGSFSKSFDYRNIGQPLPESVKYSVEAAIEALSGRKK